MILSVGAILLAVWSPWIWQSLITAAILFFAGAAIFGWQDAENRPSQDVWSYGRDKPDDKL